MTSTVVMQIQVVNDIRFLGNNRVNNGVFPRRDCFVCVLARSAFVRKSVCVFTRANVYTT